MHLPASACTMYMLSDVALLDRADGMLVSPSVLRACRDGTLYMPQSAQRVRHHSVQPGGQHHPALSLCACAGVPVSTSRHAVACIVLGTSA